MKIKVDKHGRTIIPESFKEITEQELKSGDILLFYGGNKLTAFHGRWRRKNLGRADKPPYHAAIVVDNCYSISEDQKVDDRVMILDPELMMSFSLLEEYTSKKGLRIDVVRPKATRTNIKNVKKTLYCMGKREGLYDWRGYFSFISQLPGLSWFKIIKPKKDNFFCSDACAYAWEKEGVQVSPRGHDFTAPVDLLLYGMKNSQMFTLQKA